MELYVSATANSSMRHLASCPYCNHDLTAKWRRSSFSLCKGCGIIFRNPMPSRQERDIAYMRAWQNPLDNLAETGGTGDACSSEYVRELIRTCKLQPGAWVLDYGAGRGAVMQRLRDNGINAIGIEPYGLTLLRQRGLSAYGDLETLPPHIKFDCIFSTDVVEHLAEPWGVLPKLLSRLKSGGRIVISTPNPNGLRARLQRGRWREAANPGHLCFLTPDILALLLREAGFSSVQSVTWNVRYTNSPLMNFAHHVLRRFSLDGMSRVVGTAG